MLNRLRINGGPINSAGSASQFYSGQREPDFRWVVLSAEPFSVLVQPEQFTVAVAPDRTLVQVAIERNAIEVKDDR